MRSSPVASLHGVVVALLVWTLGPTTIVGSTTTERRQATLVVTSGLAGRLVDGEHTIADLTATIRRVVAERRATGHDVLVLDTGVTLAPYAESRPDAGAAMLRALRDAGCEVFMPHPVDLVVGSHAFTASSPSATPTVLRAFGTDAPPLATLDTVARVELAEVPIAMRAFDHPDFIRDLAAAGVEATAIDPTTALDGHRADDPIQIAILHSRGQGLLDHDMAWSLIDEPRGYDLLLDPDLEADLVVRREVPSAGHAVFLVGRALSTERPWTFAVVDLELVRDPDHGWSIDRVRQTVHGLDPEATPDPQLEASVRAAYANFEHRYGRPLPDAAPDDREGLAAYVLGALREATRAEIAILDHGALRPVAEEHLTPPLTREAVVRLLSLDQGVVVGELTGRQLRELAADSVRRPLDRAYSTALRFAGLSFDSARDGTATATAERFEINGRTLYDDDLYRVATSSFLAGGGSDYPILAAMGGERWPGDGDAAELREDIVLPRLDRAAEPLHDPADYGLWRFGILDAALTFDGVEVDADPAYADVADSRASAEDSHALRGDLRFFADQEWANVRWENRLRARFGVLDTEDGELTELTDDLRFDASLVFLDRPWLAGHPYFSYTLDSELHRDRDDDRRLPRQLEQSLALGLEWEGPVFRTTRFGLLARTQNDTETADRLGLVFETDILWQPPEPWPELRADLLAETVEDGEARIDRIDLEIRLPVAVIGRVKISPGIDLYHYRDSRLPGSATYRRFLVSLAWDWSGKHQRAHRRR